MKLLKLISQLAIGAIFIFSGFVKAVDPFGGAIKLIDYFTALNIGFLEPFALFLSISLAAIEFLIGIHLLLNLRVKHTSWALIVLMVFFTLLTFYSAIANPVSDCGCFGDAWKLTNWETFFKNLILLPLALFLFLKRNTSNEKVRNFNSILISTIFTAFIVGISLYSIKHLPIIDFRPYHIGANIQESMDIPEDAEQPVYETIFILEKDGETKEFDVNNYPYDDSTWVFIDSKSTLIKEGYTPAITDFSLQSLQGEIVTEDILNEVKPTFLLIAPKLEKADLTNIVSIINLHQKQKSWDYNFYILTASLSNTIKDFDNSYGVGFEYLIADETVLKTMIRSNPGLILLQNGTIVAKWNANDLATIPDFEYPISKALRIQTSTSTKYLLGFLAALLMSITLILYKQKKLN